jgi:putative membrane protein
VDAYYNYIKSLHLIFVITWFAGLFYMPRLFIYHIEAMEKGSPNREILAEQLKLMARRLWYIITWPSAVLATIFGLLFLYHLKTHHIFKAFQGDDIQYSSLFMRVWNEGATLLLFAIVFLVILKSSFHWIFGLLSLVGLAVLLMLGIKLYQKVRKS